MDEKKENVNQRQNFSMNAMIESQLKREDLEQAKPKYNFDRLKLYFGEDYIIKTNNGGEDIVIHQPTIQDFIDLGEGNIYSSMAPFISNSTSYRLVLWDMGLDWNKYDDYKFFGLTKQMINPEYSKCVFGDLDFTKFREVADENGKIMYVNVEQKVLIDEQIYDEMKCYLRYLFDVHPKTEMTKSKSTKQDLILEDRIEENKRKREKKDEDYSSILLPKISFALNHPGFKYKKEELRTVGIVEFMDSVQRLQVYESTNALYKGMYSGFVDTKKIDKNNFNFMRDFDHA